MPSKFEIIDHKLDTILTLLEELVDKEEDELFGEDPFEDYGTADESGMEQEMMYMPENVKPRYTRVDSPGEGPPSYKPSATRTHVEVRNPEVEGEVEMVPWTEVDERIIEAVRLSSEMGEPWELWRDGTGMIRVSVEASIAHKIRKQNTVQPAPPASSEIPRDMDVDEVAKER